MRPHAAPVQTARPDITNPEPETDEWRSPRE